MSILVVNFTVILVLFGPIFGHLLRGITMATQNLRLLFFEILYLGLLKNDFIANSGTLFQKTGLKTIP